MSLLPLLHVAGFQKGNRLSKSRELASALQETSSFLKGRWAGPKHEANNVAADPTTRLVYDYPSNAGRKAQQPARGAVPNLRNTEFTSNALHMNMQLAS